MSIVCGIPFAFSQDRRVFGETLFKESFLFLKLTVESLIDIVDKIVIVYDDDEVLKFFNYGFSLFALNF